MLLRLQKSMNEKDKGFTLIELLVVVIIIGILAGIAIPVFLNQRKKGVDASLKSDLRNAASVVETWNTDNPSAPVVASTATVQSPALADFKASSGNTVKVKTGGVGTYVICAFNTGASTATGTGAGMIYDSAAGGLQTATASC